MNHEEAIGVLNSVLNHNPASYQDGDEPSVIIDANEEYAVSITAGIHPYSEAHRAVVLELILSQMFFRLTLKTKLAIRKINKNVAQPRGFVVRVMENHSQHLRCVISRNYYSVVTADQIELDHAAMSALSLVVFQAIKSSQ